ncbi:MAG: hypothetical protein Q8S73_12280 [Deltaproteobacteria bacterium]|nr:hypothetical protein [Myxococcales bacterium]MDP3214876.1 hypothetical protein [Deltaproteobacteria bacterium]
MERPTPSRAARVARDQSDWHFHFMYPVYFPECPIWHSYNAPRDGMMMDVFADLVRRFN